MTDITPAPEPRTVTIDAERLSRLGEVVEIARGFLRAVDTPGEHDARDKMFDAMGRLQAGDTDPA